MRQAEMKNGIDVYSDEALENKVGSSKICAKSAVVETALSRSVLSIACVSIPALLILGFRGIGVRPVRPVAKNMLELVCVVTALLYGLPLSVSVFPPVTTKRGADLEGDL